MVVQRAARRKPLTFERVVDVAMVLADSGGVAALTMRRLATRLRVEPMSLYHHVRNKDEILDAMVDRVFSSMAVPGGKDWKKAMRERARSIRAELLRHSWALGLLESRRSPGEATLRHHDATIRCLREAGFSIPLVAHSLPLLDAYVYGFVVQERTMPLSNPTEVEEVATSILGQLEPGAFPHLTELAMKHVMKPGYDFSKEFEHGLELILDALEAKAQVKRGKR